jgi:phosphomevalonate kinase
MSNFTTSAPGKLFLSGEYAVLEGAPAVVTSVNRRITACITRENIPKSKIIKSVSQEAGNFFNRKIGGTAGRLPNIDIKSDGFTFGRIKLGIGSSAAVAAATAGTLFEWFGLPVNENRYDILNVAIKGHMAYQDGKGSGADVATSVLGGTIIFLKGIQPGIIDKSSIKIVFIWTGNSASTVKMVDKIKDFKRSSLSLYDKTMTPLSDTANRLARAYGEDKPQDIIDLTRQYSKQMELLGKAAQIPIVTEPMKIIASIADDYSGAVKPSGAGGGDVTMAVFKKNQDLSEFEKRCTLNKFKVLSIKSNTEGLKKESAISL